jgi:hypothetical protein
MTRQDDELNEFIDEVTDGETRIKKIVQVLAAEGIKISITTDIWYSYALNSVLQYTHAVYY